MELIAYGNVLNWIGKTDTNATTSTTGYFNRIFGALAWANLNLEANPFSVLPKYVWQKSGFRIIHSKANNLSDANGNVTSKGGTTESGDIAYTVIPSVAQVPVIPKIAQIPFGASTVQEWLANYSEDDTWGALSSLRTFMAVQHKELLSQMITADVEDPAAAASSDYVYGATGDWETLDRLVSSEAENTALGNSHKYYDPYGLSRHSVTDYDSTVTSASGTIGTLGNLTDSTIVAHLASQRKAAGGDPTVAIGSHEVYSELQQIYTPQLRYGNGMGEAMITIDVNGVDSFEGNRVGLHVATLYGIPFIPAKDSPFSATHESGEVGRLFFLDTSDRDGFGTPRLGIMVAVPTTYNELTRNTQGFPFASSGFVEKGIYWTMGETVLRRFNGCGKIRDIQVS